MSDKLSKNLDYSANFPTLDGELYRLLTATPQRPKEADGDYFQRVLSSLVPTVKAIHDRQKHRASQAAYMQSQTMLYLTKDRQQHNVYLKDLPAFCKEHRLDQDRVIEVNNGQAREHKGWKAGISPSGMCSWREPIVYSQEDKERMANVLDPHGQDLRSKIVDLFTGEDTREADKRHWAPAEPKPEPITYQPKEHHDDEGK